MKRGTNSLAMREGNEKLLLSLARKGKHSRADIAKLTGLTKASVTILADRLIADGLLCDSEAGDEYSGIGRRPSIIALRCDARFAVGVDISRSGFCVGLCNLGGQILGKTISGGIDSSPDDILCSVAKAITKLTDGIAPDKIIGIGVTTPGPVDYRKGIILTPPAFDAWHGFEIVKRLTELVGFRTTLENVANASALAECYFGNCESEENFAYILVDDGIGSGIMVDGHLYRGKNGCGNELGHTSIDMNGEVCECGNRGCLEKYASVPALLKWRRYEGWKDASENESLVRREASYLAAGTVNLVNLFDLSKIVLGGAVSENGDELARLVSETVNERVITGSSVEVSVCKRLDRTVISASAVLQSFFG